MGTYYVNSGASGANNGTTKANAFTTLAAAAAAATSTGGNIFYVAHTHVEGKTGANLQIAWPAYPNEDPDSVVSVNFAGSTPPVPADYTPGARINVTGNYDNEFVFGSCHVRFYGIYFERGASATNSGAIKLNNNYDVFDAHFEDCKFRNLSGNNAYTLSVNFSVGYPYGPITLVRPQFYFQSGNDNPGIGSRFEMYCDGTSVMESGSPGFSNPWFPAANPTAGPNLIVGADLSGLPNTTIGFGSVISADMIFHGCKMGSFSGWVLRASYLSNAQRVDAINCHASGTVFSTRDWWNGILTTETTIRRTAGATDGTTPYSWKVVMNNSFVVNNERPFKTFEGQIFNSATGSANTLTCHIVTDNVTLTDNDIWLEVEYFGSAGDPRYYRATDRMAHAVLSTPANQASDSGEAWTTTGLTTPVKQKLEVTFTPQLAGFITWRVCVSKKNVTVYIDPNPDLT